MSIFHYALTLSTPGAITAVVAGSFSAPKTQELLVARGHVLELLRPDDVGKIQSVHRRGEAHTRRPPPARPGPAHAAPRPAPKCSATSGRSPPAA